MTEENKKTFIENGDGDCSNSYLVGNQSMWGV